MRLAAAWSASEGSLLGASLAGHAAREGARGTPTRPMRRPPLQSGPACLVLARLRALEKDAQ
eukprot:12304175-Alexandrium_andersonii.AAC.1